MKVYVIMGNDFPHAVYADGKEAQDWCDETTKNDKAMREGRAGFAHRINWRVYEFDLKEKKS